VAVVLAVLAVAPPADGQVRTTGRIVGTVTDPSGAVVPDVEVELTDLGTGTTVTTRSTRDGGFVFPALQPGRYRLVATAPNFQPVVVEGVVVETAGSTNVTLRFEVAAVSEQVQVEAAAPVIQTTSTTLSNTVRNEQIAKLPLSGRSVLDFALLVPGTATSAGTRFSEFNGLPGGAINITLDGINNNSQRFRSGGTSFFVFAPVRLGAIEEVTVSTGGLTADAGAEGAVQIQFVTKRGTNVFRGQAFDQIRHEALNANTPFNNARGLPKARLRQHEFGANIGGPIVQNRLFFFVNYEQIHQPSESTFTRTILTPEAQQGIFRYVATDGSVRTANLLQLAGAAGYPSTIDPFIAAQLAIINNALGAGDVAASDLIRNTFAFKVPQRPKNLYPTARVDYHVTPGLAVRGILNLHWRDLARNPQFPGLDFVNAGFTSTYYILSTGMDWAPRSNLFNQLSFGVQSNYEEFNPGNTLALYEAQGMRRIPFPLGLTSPQPTGDVLPIPRNNPVYNVIDTVTFLKGTHTFTMGGTFRRTTMWESIGGAPYIFNLGVAAGDPISSVLSTATIPGLRSSDVANALALYAFLTGRISGISGTNNVNEKTHQYGLNPVTRREAQNVGGLYVQDSWRVTPRLTLNYGLRWEFSGAAYNTNGIYTSPTLEHALGPSKAPFQPGTLSGVADPQIELRPKPYRRDFVNPAPNVGVAWNPDVTGGIGKWLLGSGRSVLRGSVGVNYYDEGLINFQTAAGSNPGLSQRVFLNPGMPGFPPGGLLLRSPIPPLATFPPAFSFPVSQSLFTFTGGLATIDPDLRTPSILNWSVGIQRELGANAAVEVRYVGNRGEHLWRLYNINEVNIFENGFLQEFKNAQRNLEINRANGRTGFGNNGLPGQVPLPIFEAAFGPRGSQPALAAGSGFANGTFITLLDQGQAGALANTLAGNSIYLCRLLGATFSPCAALGFNAPGPYPINFFQPNPFAAGSAVSVLSDEAHSRYHGLQIQYRRRSAKGLAVTANYTFARARTDRYADSPSSSANYITLRDKSLSWGPTVYDLRHTFQSYWTYDLPFGRGRAVTISNAVLDQIAGGWTVSGILRLQSGRPFLLTSGRATFNQFDAGVVLKGITVKELQKMVKVRPGPSGNVYFFDQQLIGPDGRANPQYLDSPTTPGERGQIVYLYGPGLFNVDLGLAKRFDTGRGTSFSFEALFLNAFNTVNRVVGGTGGASVSINSTTFGQTSGTAGGPRNIQLRVQFNF